MAIDDEGTATLDAQATATYAHLFHALADPTRLGILQHLASGAHRVRDLNEHLSFAQSTISKHLSFLLECGLVTASPDGRATWYALTEPHLLSQLVAAAEHLLGATGTDAMLCVHIRHPELFSPELPDRTATH